MVTGKKGYIDVQNVELVDKSGEGGDVGKINEDANIIESQTGSDVEQVGNEGITEGQQTSKLTPAEIKHALAAQSVDTSKILFIGDSWMEDDAFKSKFSGSCKFKAEVGTSPSNWLGRIGGESDVSAVCIMLGLNNPSQISQMKQLIDEAVSSYSGIPVYVQRVCHVGDNYADGGGSADELNALIDQYNSEIQSYCQSKGVNYIDTTSQLQDGQYLSSKYRAGSDSGSGSYHLNSSGVDSWTGSILSNIQLGVSTAGENTTKGTSQRNLERRELLRSSKNWGLGNTVKIVIGVGGTKGDRKLC